MSELNEAVRVTVQDAGVITVPIDATLTRSNEAADAKAVGDALALKADKSELANAITVNGQAADAQGQIIVTAEDTKISDSDSTTVKAAIETVARRTAQDIRMDSTPTAQTIAQAMASGATRTADQIAMSAADQTTVKARTDAQAAAITELQLAVSEMAEQTGADIPYQAGSAETIKQHVDALEEDKVRTVNEIGPDANGNIALERVPYADNLYSEDADQVNASFIARTTGGSGSLSDGNAWAQSIQGNRTREGYVQERIQMTITPVQRTAPAAITAVLDEATFEAFVGIAGTYTLTYYDAGGWDANPTSFGLTISNDPVDGDSITIVWDGTNDAVMTVNAVPRVVPPVITATIDRSVFVQYVAASGTIVLVYGASGWSEDPAAYGIDVQNVPVVDDQISVAYTKEVRGTITVATPTRLVATGWNLFRRALGYARVVRYSDLFGYKIGGSYSAVKFAPTLTGTQTDVSVDSNGLFQVPSDGFVFVTGGGTDTYIYTTWSDWVSGYEGDFEAYTENAVALSDIMTAVFPYGLCRVGDVRDEIDLRHKQAISRIQRMTYSEEARASAEASGLAYEVDENYIYIVRDTEEVTAITLEEEYTVSEHGLEFFDGATVPVYAEILYGVNLKDKLKRDVVTISEQTLTAAQQTQVRENIGAAAAVDLTNLRAGLTYVENGDTIAANANYTAGKFICWKGEIYRILSTINTTVTIANWTTYLTKQDGIGGALSQINEDLTSLNSNINSFLTVGFTPQSGITSDLFIRRYGRIVTVNGYLTATTAFGNDQLVGTIEVGNTPVAPMRFPVEVANQAYEAGEIAYGSIGSNGAIRITTKSGNTYKCCYFSVSYVVQS